MQSYQYKEVLTVIIMGVIILLLLVGMIVFFMLYFQQKRFQHHKELIKIQDEFKQQIFQSQLEIQEQTFNNISQEIHDNVGQILTVARIQISLLEEMKKKPIANAIRIVNNC
jgi:signal transduction histidine kinase